MDDSELRARLPKALAERLDDLRQQFVLETGFGDVDRFLFWLHQRGELSAEIFDELAADDPIEVTTLDGGERILEGISTGERRSPYELLGVVGKGAMGCVHLAKDRDLQRKVAYKTQNDRKALARFVREAQITAQLDHPNVVPVYGMEAQEDGTVGYSMKLVRGKTLKQLVREARAARENGKAADGERTLSQLLDYFLKACDAVAFAHFRRVIHRDLKPANIMVGPHNEVYVLDWGIARVLDAEATLEADATTADGEPEAEERTRVGAVVGTPRYMSPEQAAGRNDVLDERSDQFALGLILYELCMLTPAFKAGSVGETLEKASRAEKQPWSGAVPAELRAIVDRATAFHPSDRYAAVSEMAADVRRHLRGEAPLARPDNAWRKALRWVGAHREIALVVLLGVILCACGAVIAGMIRHGRALEQARRHEAALVKFVTRVSQQSQATDRYFQRMEALLQGLSKATTHALTHGEPSEDPWHVNDAYAKAPRKLFDAPDLIPSPYYTGEISTTWPTFELAPGVTAKSVAPKLRRIASLRRVLKDVLVESYTDGGAPPPKEVWDRVLANEGAPLMWSYVCLKEGVELWYPGHDEPTKDYDPRVRSYYTQSFEKHEIVWGVPYDDLVGGLLIPCTQGIFDESGAFLGTVGVDMRISYVDQKFLRIPDARAFRAGYLLNENGEVVLRSGDAVKPAHRLGLEEKNILKPYPNASVVQAIVRQQPGGTLTDGVGASRRLIVYDRLSTLGWYYVIEADYAQVLGDEAR